MDVNVGQILLWGALPYVSFAVFVVGLVWRYRYDKFGWTTRSSELYERRLLRLGSPLFHFGLLFVFLGHVAGLVIPKSWTRAVGISQEAYHLGATYIGSLAALALVAGLVILIYRRRTTGAVFKATTRNDKTMYVFLAAVILAGTYATVRTQLLGGHGGYDYRETISPWFRSLWVLHPRVELMTSIPAAFAVHIVLASLLFCLWPFTRLVHAFSAPVTYPLRPYVVYRSRDERLGSRAPRRGWERTK
ncbi:MAG: respiratory nitrate reductase subunit gamma [Promicromonosporaceae bacterium]|nr:respiratory nitrate reductase subunit gamma [Promicromonosporaceae bacterium]